ncbi:PREDICTED: uncharacterized protein LOC109176198 isoform X2 [Ipomoea nil]|uniref:uncharacterized protein LOC109176198 isoform X2 n=1 Tax=Ipomoea nil TaxID=35883 RepID=UPI0009015CA5|nr:PREDICTED: uncharacterized protein LOC109176198 isoform X2 [Ipomoea nil]
MVAEPWLLRMRNQVSNNVKHALLLENSKKQEKQVIGILSFEVANVMSKVVHLHKSLSDPEISKLNNEILKCVGIRTLVSGDETRLLELAFVEKLDDLDRVASVVSRLGKKCTIPALQGFEHVYGDITSGLIDVREFGFLVKDMEGMVKKMERYVGSTASLYREMEVLNELELCLRKFQQNQHEETRKAYEHKLVWQKQDVRHLKDASLWNQNYDKVVEMLARTVCTVYARINTVFGVRIVRRDSLSVSNSGAHDFEEKHSQIDLKRLGLSKKNPSNHSGVIGRTLERRRSTSYLAQSGLQRSEGGLFSAEDFNFACGIGPGRLFMECLSLSSATRRDDDDDDVSRCCSVTSGTRRQTPNSSRFFTRSLSGIPFRGSMSNNNARFGPKTRVLFYAPPSTVGGSALSLHYANIIIVIEKLLCYPHLVGEEARNDLYLMLPTSIRKALKTNLKSYMNGLAIYDAPLAHGWKERLEGTLEWLSPLAHNMIRWQSERNFEQQQQVVTRANVLLLQTLFFCDCKMTEAAICELLVGLNYICWYEHQQNALLDCASSFDLEDYVEW